MTVIEYGGGNCPLKYNYAQEQFLISCYRAEQAGRPAFDFWNVPNYVKQGMNILGRTEADEQNEQQGK